MELGPTQRVFFIGDLMVVNLNQLWGIRGDTGLVMNNAQP